MNPQNPNEVPPNQPISEANLPPSAPVAGPQPNQQPIPAPPIMPQQPPPVAQVPQGFSQPPAPPYYPPPKAAKSKVGLIVIAVVLILVGLITAATLLWIMVFSPAAQAKSASTAFMNAASNGDKESLYTINGSTDDSDKQFLDQVATNLQGSYKQIEQGSKDNNWYFLYELDGAQSKYARTIVHKDNGKYTVYSVVYGNQKLELVPADSAAINDSATPAEPSATPDSSKAEASQQTQATGCLEQDDYKWMNYDKQPSSVTYDTTLADNTFNYETDMFFKPNSIDEDSFIETYDDWAEFASKNSGKQWTFILKGQINNSGENSTANPADVKLASDRTDRVKQALINRGVPSSRIVVIAPTDNSADYSKGSRYEYVGDGGIFRSVKLVIDPTCKVGL